MIPVGYFHLALAITEKIKEKKDLLIAAYIVFFVFILTNLTPYFVSSVEPIMGFKFWPMANYLNSIYWFGYCSIVLYSALLLVKKYKSSKGVEKMQLKYVAIGTIISFVCGSFNIFGWYRIAIPPVANVFNPTFVLLMAYAITRYRLMDIKIIARNILFYFGMALSIYAIFYVIAFSYKYSFGNIFAKEGYLAGLFIAPFFAVLLYSGSKYLSNFINIYFFYSLYNYQQAIKEASQKLSRYADMDKIAEIIIDSIKKTMQSDNIAILFTSQLANQNKAYFDVIKKIGFKDKDVFSVEYDAFSKYFQNDEKILIKEELSQELKNFRDKKEKEIFQLVENQIRKYDIYVCVPLVNNNKLIGIIILGDNPDKDSYAKEDFDFLETLSHQVQIAINNALLYKKVEEKNKYLQELLNIKNDFIRIANHQLNTPLSIMRNAYSLVSDKTITPKKGLEYIGNGLNRMSEVVDDFWSVSQLEGEIKLNLQKINIDNIIKDIIKTKKRMAMLKEKKLKIFVEKPKFKIPNVWCDIKQTNHIINNLLDNAVFYTQKGNIIISYEQVKNNNYLKINIKDTGIGFSNEERNNIGQKFYRSKKALLSHPDGSGLGIYIAKKIIETNNGEFSFNSEGEGKGSIFSFTVPVYKNNK